MDHVINHGLTMREAGERVQPNLSRYTVASIIRTFRLENRYVFSSLLYLHNCCKCPNTAPIQCIPTIFGVTVCTACKSNLIFYRTARRLPEGGRRRLFTHEQEQAIANIVLANNTIRLHQLREQILADETTFQNINHVSTSTLCRILRQQHLTMKQLYRVPFERNSIRVKDLRYDYVQVSVTVLYWNIVMAVDSVLLHKFR